MTKKLLLFNLLLFATGLFAQPVISTATPLEGYEGTSVSLTGTFSASGNKVLLGGMEATIDSESATAIDFTVPYGYMNRRIQVQNSTGLSGFSVLPFQQTYCNDFSIQLEWDDFFYKTGASGANRNAVTADFDGDGDLDLAVCAQTSDSIWIFPNTSTYGEHYSYDPPIILDANGPVDMEIGDFNGDGKMDIATCSFYGNVISVFLNTSGASISFDPEYTTATDVYPYDVCADDVDGDGNVDIITNNYLDNKMFVFLSDGAATPSFTSYEFSTGLSGFQHEIRTGDLDGDGDREIVMASLNSGAAVFMNNSTPGSPSFTFEEYVFSAAGAESVRVDDYDGDGMLDIAAVGQITSNLHVALNNWDGSSFGWDESTFGSTLSLGMGSGDINGDGLVDIAVGTNLGSNNLRVFLNQSTPGSLDFESDDWPGNSANIGSSHNNIVADLNNDGAPEIINCPKEGHSVMIYNNPSKIEHYFIDSVTVCTGGSYTYPDGSMDVSITVPTTHYSNFTNIYGCDSIYETVVDVGAAWETDEDVDICAGQSYIFPDGNVIDNILSDTSYVSMLVGVTCDSNVTTNVNVSTFDLTVNSTTWSAEAMHSGAGVTYQWIDCSTGDPIAGATDATFDAPYDGSFACVINDVCTDTTDCVGLTMGPGSIDENEISFAVYPNPTNQDLALSSSLKLSGLQYAVRDMSGKVVLEGVLDSSQKFSVDGIEQGSYVLSVKGQSLNLRSRFVRL